MARRSPSPRWSWARPVLGLAILAGLVGWLGTDAFLAPLRRLDGAAVVAAAALAFLSTVCAAWRWRVVAAGLGSDLPLHLAVAAYYRSQFLNLVLPGGVLGDVDRAVRRGRAEHDLPRAARAVVGERCAGQLVQVVLTVAVLLALPSPVRRAVPILLAALAGVAVIVMVAWVVGRRGGRSTTVAGRLVALARRTVGRGPARAWWVRSGPRVVVASALAFAGHAATFVIAARAAGSSTALTRLLPLAFLVLLAMAVPAHVAGWGPREGVAAWAFGAAGLGAAAGVGAAVVYGVLSLIGVLPGGVLLVASIIRRRRSASEELPSGPSTLQASSGVAHG